MATVTCGLLAMAGFVVSAAAAEQDELAGLIWFHGVADAKSDAMSADYEKHLANLIRDLRRDLGAPDLPVAALAKCGGSMNPNEQKVFDAQMAVGDGQKYPAFAVNVISIDTRTFCKPADQSPGGRDRYKGNAESYLQIGDAMAQAMLELLSAQNNPQE